MAQKRSEAAGLEADRAAMHSRTSDYNEAMDDSVFGISMPVMTESDATLRFVATDAQALHMEPAYNSEGFAIRNNTPAVASSIASFTPSTRFTDSPFSHVPTPSSVSSYSPGISSTCGSIVQNQQLTPDSRRPPVSGRSNKSEEQPSHGLAPVRELSTSSSDSTVKTSAGPSNKRDPSRRESLNSITARSSTSRKPVPNSGQASGKTKVTESTRSRRPTSKVPPELAHLNVEPVARSPARRPFSPPLPGRDSIPSLIESQPSSPVVKSDLTYLNTTCHRRTPSLDPPDTPTSPPPRSRFGFSPRRSSKQQSSPRIDSAVSPTPSDHGIFRGPTPDATAQERPHLLRKDSPALGPSPSPVKTSRFAFLSRKPKGDQPRATEKPKREPRKGPAAGTGHEGYGRFGFRGRSGSGSTSSYGRSTSADSNTSSSAGSAAYGQTRGRGKNGPELDDFLKERLTPVILRGSGSTFGNPASSSVFSEADSVETRSIDSFLVQPQRAPSAMSSQADVTLAKRASLGLPKPSDSSEDDRRARSPAHTSSSALNKPLPNVKGNTETPRGIGMLPPAQPASVDGYDSEASVDPQRGNTRPLRDMSSVGSEAAWLRSVQVAEKPAEKSAKKWNFFQRMQSSSPSKGKQKVDVGQVSANEPRRTIFDNAAHCAMLDLVEPIALDEVERLVMESETSAEDSSPYKSVAAKAATYEHERPTLPRSPPTREFSSDAYFTAKPITPSKTVREEASVSPELLRAQAGVLSQAAHLVNITKSSEKARLSTHGPAAEAMTTSEATSDLIGTPDMGQCDGSPRQARLSPIGRIPHVVSKRDRDRKLPSTSFSRPFVSSQPRPSVKPPGALYNQIRTLASPVEGGGGGGGGGGGSQPVSSTSGKSDRSSTGQKSSMTVEQAGQSTNRTSVDMRHGSELFAFPPRKRSEASSSSSSCSAGWMDLSTAQAMQDDDIWDEYNEQMEEMMPPRQQPVAADASLGVPFQYSGSNALQDARGPAASAAFSFGLHPPRKFTSALPLPPRPAGESANSTPPHRTAQLLRPSASPSTPDTLSRLIGAYEGTSAHSMASQPRQSISQALQRRVAASRASTASSRNSRASAQSRTASLPEGNFRSSHTSFSSGAQFGREGSVHEVESEVKSGGGGGGGEQTVSANLRLAALMTSKWLSFGRVLFSPAHHEMRLADEARVLVLDGLGSDWSYYVARSYPQATVYELGPTAGQTALPEGWPAAPNRRHIAHAAISSPFPFPKGFFTAVVLRFPVATTDHAYSASVCECKRVLRPGGHLEVSVLDLDLMNMGGRARRAVRGLKTRKQQRDDRVSLRSLSDLLVGVIGRRGFEEVQRCVVGVPVAGRLRRSRDTSSVSSETSSGRLRIGSRMGKAAVEEEEEREVSFADLLDEGTEQEGFGTGKASDESITKMVAKVGRWWYSTCYERGLPMTDNSIWNEKGLLRECETQGTSFRLLICYAQKPTQARRRTMSV